MAHEPPLADAVDPVRYAAAAARFRAFFAELREVFVERDDVLAQIALALLCKEHVLLTGPPGTAKSQLASAVFRRIVDEDTGKPSIYARQLTESTVQTDLVGPIDFKTLVETGRTEHFTDEGMLGAVHAFLDEVFDGRDALLRSALNVLHERELKQGTRTTEGAIECALMTSNRYISSVLEESRETLLAFVDRIAFVGFVPRGFADPSNLKVVLRRHVAGASRPLLEAPLTIQDLDVLQAAVDSVDVSDAICEGLAALLALLDEELSAAVRADPTFVATRYLSTRTAVRSGRILRAIAVHDRIFRAPERRMAVLPEDLPWLRLHLLLGGPTPAAAARLVERENDPEERRQLGIVRTEREIFERCLKKLPVIRVPEPARPRPATVAAPAAERGPASARPLPAPDDGEIGRLEESLVLALRSQDVADVTALLKTLAPIAAAGRPESERASRLVRDAVGGLTAQALHAGLTARGRPHEALREAVTDLGSLADLVDNATPATRGLARWLRGRGLDLLAQAAAYAPGASIVDLELVTSGAPEGAQASRAAERLDTLEGLDALRRELYAKGADVASREASDGAWRCAVGLAEDDLVLLLDAALRDRVKYTLAQIPPDRLGDVLASLAPDFERIDAIAKRLAGMRGTPSSLKARVVGPRIGALVGAVFGRIEAVERHALLAQLDTLLGVLRAAGLDGVIAPKDWVSWTAGALVRGDGGAPPSQPSSDPSHEGYRALRGSEQRVPNAYTLAEVALRTAPGLGRDAATPADGISALAALLSQVPEPLRGKAVRLDLDRIERAVGYLERWWKFLAGLEVDGVELTPRKAREMKIAAMVKSRFFKVLLDESAPMRFALEARVLAEMFPDHSDEASALRGRLESLSVRARQTATELLLRRADDAWADTLKGAEGAAS